MVQQAFRPFSVSRPNQSSRFGQQNEKAPQQGANNTRIDFPTLPKPTNLSNSAVLRLLAEDEPRLRRVIWPPPSPPLVETEVQDENRLSPASPHQKPATPSPPPSTITLRSQPPISQLPQPVFVSQPATATMQGGKHLRGDLKWPPENYKKQAEAENEARLAIAKGPLFRPRKVNRDYSQFFAQHALTTTYPGYRVPPGTQHYTEEGTSNL